MAKECNTEGDRCLSSLVRLVHLTRVSSCGTVFLDEQKVETHNPPRLHLSRLFFFFPNIFFTKDGERSCDLEYSKFAFPDDP